VLILSLTDPGVNLNRSRPGRHAASAEKTKGLMLSEYSNATGTHNRKEQPIMIIIKPDSLIIEFRFILVISAMAIGWALLHPFHPSEQQHTQE
jgi:hypothetical protein